MRGSVILTTCLLTLAGCGAGRGDPPPGSPEAECRADAYDDPAVKDAIMRSNTQLAPVKFAALHDLDLALKQATHRCLAARGLAPPGGVEPVRSR